MAAVQGAAREREGLRSRRLLRNPGSSATRSPCRTVQESRPGVNLRYGHNASAEQFGPRELLAYAQQAEEVGLHTIAISDHFQFQRDLRGAKANGPMGAAKAETNLAQPAQPARGRRAAVLPRPVGLNRDGRLGAPPPRT